MTRADGTCQVQCVCVCACVSVCSSLENRVQFLLPGSFYASYIFGKTHLQIAKAEIGIGIDIEIEFMHLNFLLALFLFFYCYFPEIIN